jgi:type IV pilus assembly protein PilA
MTKRHLAVLAVFASALVGCGGGDSNGGSSAKPAESPAKVNQQDAAAKSDARNLVTEVETCFVDQQDYTACQEPPDTQLTLDSGPGQVEVSAADTATYTVSAHSESGTAFEVEKDSSGSLSRSCDKPGKGGCRAGGTW